MTYMHANVGFIHKDLLRQLPELKECIDLNMCIGMHSLLDYVFDNGKPRKSVNPEWYDADGACRGLKVFSRSDETGAPLARNPEYVMFSVSKGN